MKKIDKEELKAQIVCGIFIPLFIMSPFIIFILVKVFCYYVLGWK